MVSSIEPMTGSLLAHRTHYHAQLFKVMRLDGFALYLTTASSSLEYLGDTYTPIGSIETSAFRSEAALKDANVDYQGVISSDKITTADLVAGKYRGATVEVFLIDWRFPFLDPFLRRKYTLGDVSFDGEKWTAEAWGVMRRLQQKVGDRFVRTCVHDLGSDSSTSDFDCRKDITTAPFTNTEKPVGDVTSRRVFRVNGLPTSLGDDYFKDGTVTITETASTSPNNLGTEREIKSSVDEGAGSHTIELYLPFPFDLATTTDEVTLVAGCLKRIKVDCEGKFSNKANNGSFPLMPGQDTLLKTPKAK
jgi:uncharacterized phage protein (TIGR02218 family)